MSKLGRAGKSIGNCNIRNVPVVFTGGAKALNDCGMRCLYFENFLTLVTAILLNRAGNDCLRMERLQPALEVRMRLGQGGDKR